MKGLADNIAVYIASELGLDDDKREVMAYGTFALLHTVLSISLVILFGLIFHMAIEALIISVTTSVLRKYSGGVHASSPGNCALLGTVMCVGQAFLITFVVGPTASLNIILLLVFIGFTWSYYIVIRLAPVDSLSKPIRKVEKRKRMKKGSLVILTVQLIIAVLNIVLYLFSNRRVYVIYALCIGIGIVWQAFTLTKPGHIFFLSGDKFITYILNKLRGGKLNEKIK